MILSNLPNSEKSKLGRKRRGESTQTSVPKTADVLAGKTESRRHSAVALTTLKSCLDSEFFITKCENFCKVCETFYSKGQKVQKAFQTCRVYHFRILTETNKNSTSTKSTRNGIVPIKYTLRFESNFELFNLMLQVSCAMHIVLFNLALVTTLANRRSAVIGTQYSLIQCPSD